MIVLLRADADADAVASLEEGIRELGLGLVPLDEAKGRAFEVVGSDRGRVLALHGAPAVEEILTRRTRLVGGEPLWPHFAVRLSIVVLLISVVLILLAAIAPAGLGDPAGGTAASDGLEWYLRPLAAFLALFPARLQWLGGLVVALLWIGLFAWPFLDRAQDKRAVLFARVLGAAVMLLVLALALRWPLW